jgi:hypothetical protein
MTITASIAKHFCFQARNTATQISRAAFPNGRAAAGFCLEMIDMVGV